MTTTTKSATASPYLQNHNATAQSSVPKISLNNDNGPTSSPPANLLDSKVWVTIRDPQSGHTFYAHPNSGECRWDLPTDPDVFVLPRSEKGEWWELIDDSRGGLPYYYHTQTEKTVWTRPNGDDQLIIPLRAIQNSAIGKRMSTMIMDDNFDAVAAGAAIASNGPRTVPSRRAPDPKYPQQSSPNNPHHQNQSSGFPASSSPPAQQQRLPNSTGQRRPSAGMAGEDPSSASGPGPRGSPSSATYQQRYTTTSSVASDGSQRFSEDTQMRGTPNSRNKASTRISAPIAMDANAAAAMSPVSNHSNGPAQPIMLGNYSAPSTPRNKAPPSPLASKRLSTGDHMVLPTELQHAITQFAIDGFAKQYFATHKRGIFRRKVPMETLLRWEKNPLKSPLVALHRDLHKDAAKCFRVIQYIMGDKTKGAGVSVALAPGTTATSYMTRELQRGDPILEEEQWLLDRGILRGELRDEIFVQVVKQLTENPSGESIFRGWQLMCVLLTTFPPSKNLEPFLKKFLHQHKNIQQNKVGVMATFCVSRLDRISKKGHRGKVLTLAEIRTASDAAFNPSVFGESLASVMQLQQKHYPNDKVPIILPFLTRAILMLRGTSSEGIFRVPGDADLITELKVRIEQGKYNLEGIDDANVPASLVKFWLRDLAEPVIPVELYDACISSLEDPDKVIAIVKGMPVLNRRVTLFVISFLQIFASEQVARVTKMNVHNLAMVYAPNFLRCPSDNLTVIFENAKYEQAFVRTMILHLPCGTLDPDYQPRHGAA